MAKKIEVKISDLAFFLQLVVGAFFFLLGLYGILPSIEESVFSLANSSLAMEVVFGVLELISSAVLIVGLFLATRRKLMAFVSFMIFLFWTARIILTKFILGIWMSNGAFRFTGGLANWLLILSVELIILVAILVINRRYAD